MKKLWFVTIQHLISLEEISIRFFFKSNRVEMEQLKLMIKLQKKMFVIDLYDELYIISMKELEHKDELEIF